MDSIGPATSSPPQSLQPDVTILGAGPGGCSAAILLAEAGLNVIVLEKSRFPRFRIGESLLPNGNPLLRRLGVWDRLDAAGFLRKYGAEFTVADGSNRVHNRFAHGLIPDCGYTYQVERAPFDTLLLERAAEAGATIYQQITAQSVSPPENDQPWLLTAISATGAALEIRTRWLIDASGRDSFLAKQLKLQRDPLPYPKRVAIYRHYHGIPLQPGERSGNIIITRLSDGWFWNIPLSENLTSLGVVASLDRFRSANLSPEAFFEDEIQRSSQLRHLTRDAQPAGPAHVTTDYSFMHESFAGERHFLVGDAAAFVDPIFSSGVYLAMHSAVTAADLLLQAEKQGRGLRSSEAARFTNRLKKSLRTMRDLIEVFYDNSGFAVFLHPTHRLKLAAAVNTVVAGNTRLPFSVWWRFQLFLLICRVNRFLPLVPYRFPKEQQNTTALPSTVNSH